MAAGITKEEAMQRDHALSFLVLVVCALLVSSAAPASDGRIPVYQATTITAPGAYYLTQDISIASGYGITIQAHGVTLDLDGHSLLLSAGCSGVYASGWNHIRITNGKISGGAYGINLYNSTDVQVDHLVCSGQSAIGIHIAQGSSGTPVTATVEACSVNVPSTATHGIDFEYVSGGRIVGNSVSGSMIYLGNTNETMVSDNTVFASGGNGIELVSSSNANWINHNTVADNTGYGIVLYNSVHNSLDRNLAARNGVSASKEGILFGSGASGNIYSFNRCEGNGAAGIAGTAGNINGGGNIP
jgi:parallel beta-helix repeat protein